MVKTKWALKGDYFETCSCDYLCPCIFTRMEAMPTGGDCKVSMVFQIKKGSYGRLALDGLVFAVLGHAPGPMGEGNWRVGLIIDQRASDKQAEAITSICSGKAGGPMAMMAPLVGKFEGTKRGRFTLEKKKMSFSISVPGVLEQHATGVESLPVPGKPIYIDNAGHPANTRLALARGTRSQLHAFGIDWDDVKGGHNAHFAAFNWAA
ncbi:MAG: DUF1326 domain-containing protein [Alphaproteobacteria bacterium]|nr:DUF1326 domain-containing protein [Alphaproteobacteria bacterium]